MAKKREVNGSDVTATIQNGNHSVVVQMKAMGMQEKARIEKLIDSRAEALKSYLDEMEKFALEANENTVLTDSDKSNAVKKELAIVTIERERLTGQKEGEITAAESLLESQHEKKMLKLKQIEIKLVTKNKELVATVKSAVNLKYQKKEDVIIDKETALKQQLVEMERAEKAQKLMRKVALVNSLRALKDDVGDYRNKAVEKLHTEVVENSGAKACLAMIPDATEFRREVSPEKLFMVFNDNVKSKVLTQVVPKCLKCGSTDHLQESSRGEMYCRKCGKYDVLSDEVKKMVVLPSLREIAEVSKAHVEEVRPVIQVNVVNEVKEQMQEESELEKVYQSDAGLLAGVI